METVIARITSDQSENNRIYEQASEVLRNGGLVAFPTETVYGLGANALDAKAASKIYQAKGRPSDNPLIVHIADMQDLFRLASEVSGQALKLAEAFWPGPLTMILKKNAAVPETTTGGLDTVAVRMPSHQAAERLIRTSGIYIAAPSANLSGKPSPTKASHVISDMAGRIDMIIADDTVEIGLESTIVDMSGQVPAILRPGFITQQQLSQVLGEVAVDPAVTQEMGAAAVPRAPGMKYKHYAPEAELVIVQGQEQAVVDRINQMAEEKMAAGAKVGVLAAEETCGCYKADVVKALGKRADEAAAAKNLFAALREFDSCGVDYIYSEPFPTDNVGQAVMNRLIKAAGHTIVDAGIGEKA